MISRLGKRILVLLVALTLAHVVVEAEVGAIYESGISVQAGGPYVLSIIEDGDPVTAAWTRYSPLLGSRQVLNQDGASNGDGLPSVLFNPISGLPIVTWGKNNGSSFDIVESHFENGAWTTPAVIAAGVATSVDPEPWIALDRQTGDVHIVYFTDTAATTVMHTQAPANLASWTPSVQVSEIGENALRPSAVIHLGTLTVAYESHGSNVGSAPRQITVATSDGLGGFTHDTIATTHCGDPNRPQLHAGTGSALWIDWLDDTNDMAWTTWQPVMGWGSVQIEPFTDVEDRDYHARGKVKRLATQ